MRDRIYNNVVTSPKIPNPLAAEKTPHNKTIIKFCVFGNIANTTFGFSTAFAVGKGVNVGSRAIMSLVGVTVKII